MAAGPKQRKRAAIRKAADNANTKHYIAKYAIPREPSSGALHSCWYRWPVNSVVPNGWLTKPVAGFALHKSKLAYEPRKPAIKGRWKA